MKDFSGHPQTKVSNSIKTLIFFLNLRRSLMKIGLTIQAFFQQKFILKNRNIISQVQFVKLISFSESKFSSIEVYEIFNELRVNEGIPFDLFIYRYHKIDKNHPVDKMKEIQSKKIDEEQANRDIQKKLIRLGLMKLQKYVRQNGPMQLFDECDDERNGYLTKQQFNKFLIATDIKQLSDRTIRQVLIKKVFSYYKDQKMTKEGFMSLFKVDIEEEKKKQEKKRLQLEAQNARKMEKPKMEEPPKQYPLIPQYQPPEQIFKKKHLIFEKPAEDPTLKKRSITYQHPEIKPTKSQSFESNEADILDVRAAFPRSYRMYRLGIPSPEQFPIFEELESYLERNGKYVDKQNPETKVGTYTPAEKIFNGEKYEIFQMAASVLNRQKSRIGLARQIEPKDIIQGQIGDCYLLSSIASIISIYPEVLSQRFIFMTNSAHFYAVKLFIDGEWKIFCTDDQFPCQYGKPVYAKPHGNEIWVLLIEKCWAKQFGSYDRIDSGTPTEGFRAITGAPTEYFSTDNEEQKKQMYDRLKEAYEKRYVATCSGSDELTNMPEKDQQKIGLISDHAYSFLKFLNINGQTVVKMRNPWGKTIWKGDWSFQSKKWTKQLRDQYNYHNQPFDGSFYMPWNLFIRYFSNFVICHLDPTATHTTHKFTTNPHKSNYFKILVKTGGRYNFGVYQESKRKVNSQNYEYSPVRLVVAHEFKGDMNYVASVNKASHGVYCESSNIVPGIYYIAVKMDWEGRKSRPIVLSIYGQQKVELEPIDNSIAPFFKKGVIYSYSRQREGKRKQYDKLNIPEAYNQTFFSIPEGIGYLKMKNPSKKWFSTTYSMKKSSGVKPIKPAKLPFKFDMQPESQFIIGFWVSCRGYSYESSESMQTKRW